MFRKLIATLLVGAMCLFNVPTTQAQAPVYHIVDHTSYALFEQMPPHILAQALATRVEFADASVGANVKAGLDILKNFVNLAACAPTTNCETFRPGTSQEDWNGPFPMNVTYHTTPGNGLPTDMNGCVGNNGLWTGFIPCWTSYLLTDNRFQDYDLLGALFNYNHASWSDSMENYWTSRAGSHDVYDTIAFSNQVGKPILHMGSSIMKGTDVVQLTRLANFNQRGRDFVMANGGTFFDIAAFTSHTFLGVPCTYNNLPIICLDWNNEPGPGGHISYGSAQVRAAKIFLVAVAFANGWDGTSGPPPLSITCPPDVSQNALNEQGAYVTFAEATAAGGVEPYTFFYEHQSGNFFPMGLTEVNVQVADSAGASETCSFNITVADIVGPGVVLSCFIIINPEEPDALSCGGNVSGRPYGAGEATITIHDALGNPTTITVPINILNP